MAVERAAIAVLAVALSAASPAFADPDFDAPKNAPREVLAADARAGCLADYAEPVGDMPCQLAKFGAIGTFNGHSFDYARYAFTTEGGGSMGGRVLIFERLDGDRLRILFVPEIIGGPFYNPKLIGTPAGVLLHFAGFDTGTGNFNRERLYIWRTSEWRPVDTTSWLDTLAKRLPKGLGAWKGVYPDYRTMKASTPLWRTGDGNASPTGGRAAIRLGWRGDKIVLQSVSVRRSRGD
ncbi:MAG TPA: hypothetical protein VK522_20070 [Pseudolabrys sp.]|nr:hypothetical protein [Pseudolabrys sp.]